MNIDQKIESNYLLGAVCVNGNLSFYMNPLAYWIMNTKAYDPTYNPNNSLGPPFRNGVFIVDNSNIEPFLEAIEPDRISIEEVIQYIPEFGEELTLYFLIDFDNKLFVNGYVDVEIEKYVPQDWEGISDNPLNYLPNEVKAIWR